MKCIFCVVAGLLVCSVGSLTGCDKGGKGYAKEALKSAIAERYPACTASDIRIRNCTLTRTELNAEYYDASGACAISCVAQEPALINGKTVAPGDRIVGQVDASFSFAKGASGNIKVTRNGINSIDIDKN